MEVRQRLDDGLLHGVEGLAVDTVGEQRRLERVVPPAAPVEHDGLALGPVERGGQRHRDRVPRGQLGLVRSPATSGIGIVGHPPHHAHRQRLDPAVPVGHRGRQPRRDLAVQPGPGHAAGQAQVGGQAFLGLGHLVLGRLRGAPERVGVIGRVLAGRHELGHPEAGRPALEALGQAGQVGELGLQPRPQPGRGVVGGVRADERVQVGRHQPHLVEQPVRLAQHLVEGGHVGVGRPALPGLAVAHVVAVVQRHEASQVGDHSFVGHGQLTGLEGREHGADIPVRQRVGGGARGVGHPDGCSSAQPSAATRRVGGGRGGEDLA